MFGIACGRKAMKSKTPRPGSFERSATQEKAMASARVRVGVATVRKSVLRAPMKKSSHGIRWKLTSDKEASASAEGSWKYGSTAAQIVTASGKSFARVK